MAYEGKMDSLTGLLTRRAFFSTCAGMLQTISKQGICTSGYFIMMDLDYFKEINDAYGHPEGDRALKEAAKAMKEIFGRGGIISRIGGDEFAILLCTDMTRPELEVELQHFLDRIHRFGWGERHLTISIGALSIQHPCAPEELYRRADRLLYEAKARGRDQYVIGGVEPEENRQA